MLAKANDMYRGELLPGNLSETWFLHKSNYFKELYLFTMEELEKEYLRTNDYRNRMRLYTKAASIYPFENWQIKLIRCNLEAYRYEEALDIYNKTMELYSKEMGMPPTAELQECFEELELLDENHKRGFGSVNGWKNLDKAFIGKKSDIKQAIFGEGDAQGAYYCTYPSFVDYCRLIVRAKERMQVYALLMFLTLSKKGIKGARKQMDLSVQMDLLKTVIGDSLRIGDAYTRYGNRHFILMLVNVEMEHCATIFERIERAYNQKSGKGELWYYADMTQELKESVL